MSTTTEITPNEERQLTLQDMTGKYSEEEIARLLEEPSLTLAEAETSVIQAPQKAMTPARPAKAAPKAAPTAKKAPVPIQGTNTPKPMTTTPKPKKVAVPQGWTAINSRNADAIAAFGTQHGITPAGILQMQNALLEQNFLSDVQVFDLTEQFSTPDEDGIVYSDFLIGDVACRTGNSGGVERGFRFDPKVAQKVLIVKGSIYTELEDPHPTTKLMQGPRQAIFVCFPETIPGVTAQKGTRNQALAPYRPLIRLMTQHITDGTVTGDEMNNVYFQTKTRGVGRFNDQIPNFVYAAALRAGVTDEQLLMRTTNTEEIQLRSQARARSPRNRAGYTSNNGGVQGQGGTLPGFTQTLRDPAASLGRSIGNGFNARS
jgi:hypothetical protein